MTKAQHDTNVYADTTVIFLYGVTLYSSLFQVVYANGNLKKTPHKHPHFMSFEIEMTKIVEIHARSNLTIVCLIIALSQLFCSYADML